MLFVQTRGDRYPVSDRACVPQSVKRAGPEAVLAYAQRRCIAMGRTHWWLVECASAAAGRDVIDRLRTHTDMGTERVFAVQGTYGRFVAKGEIS